jgi:urea transport system permease protein
MRDKEDRVRFSGYDVAMFRVFTFCLAAMLSAIGGAMFALQVGFMSPSLVGIVPSIEMVIFAAVGGRMSLVGAVYGTVLVSVGKTYFSESAPDLWLFLMAALYIGVVMVMPDGLAGLYQNRLRPWFLACWQGWIIRTKKSISSRNVVEQRETKENNGLIQIKAVKEGISA